MGNAKIQEKKNCLNCGKLFKPKRSTALFCSSACRQQNHKKKKGESVSFEDVKNIEFNKGFMACFVAFQREINLHKDLKIEIELLSDDSGFDIKLEKQKSLFFERLKRL